MKIYQIHETVGQWEDYFDYIVGTYLHKDRAESEVQKLVTKEVDRQERYRKCSNCPIIDNDLQSDTLEYAQHACSNYCSNAQIYEDKFGYDCENYEGNYDNSSFRIDEVEVEE